MTIPHRSPAPERFAALAAEAEEKARLKQAELSLRLAEKRIAFVGLTVLSAYARPFLYVSLGLAALLWAWSANMKVVGDGFMFNALTGAFCVPGDCVAPQRPTPAG